MNKIIIYVRIFKLSANFMIIFPCILDQFICIGLKSVQVEVKSALVKQIWSVCQTCLANSIFEKLEQVHRTLC